MKYSTPLMAGCAATAALIGIWPREVPAWFRLFPLPRDLMYRVWSQAAFTMFVEHFQLRVRAATFIQKKWMVHNHGPIITAAHWLGNEVWGMLPLPNISAPVEHDLLPVAPQVHPTLVNSVALVNALKLIIDRPDFGMGQEQWSYHYGLHGEWESDIVRLLETALMTTSGGLESLRSFIEELRDEHILRKRTWELYWYSYRNSGPAPSKMVGATFRRTGGARGLERRFRVLAPTHAGFPAADTNM